MKTFRAIQAAAVFISWFFICNDSAAKQKDESDSPRPTPFVEVVKQYFSKWDKDDDGKLTPHEISLAVGNPKFQDESAAAIATIRIFAHKDNQAREIKLADLLQPSKELLHGYNASLERLHGASRELFAQKRPSIDAIKQKHMGDCYFVSVVGSMVYRNPSTIKNMIKEKEKGWLVEFKNGEKVIVDRVTDADIIICAYAGDNGLWLAILEKAYRNDAKGTQQGDQRDRYDRIDHGGQAASVIEKLDGQKASRINLSKRRGTEFADTIRKDIKLALHENRLVNAGTGKKVTTPHIVPTHAYAVLGFNSKTDLVRVWNPWGNNFTPEGSDGLRNGYTTKDGQFDIPMEDFLEIYQGLTIETRVPNRH
ncbi:MAG: C2 family cysteine protease [Verrucomicrobiota bacterium]